MPTPEYQLLREELGNPSENTISDAMLERLLEEEGSFKMAAMRACRVIARAFSLRASKSIGRTSKDYSRQAQLWLDMAKEYEEEIAGLAKPLVGGISKSQKIVQEEDGDRITPFFGRDKFEEGYNDY